MAEMDFHKTVYLLKQKTNNSDKFFQIFQHLFLRLSLQQKQPCVSVLGVKRSNIITIALSSLPPVHLLPPAIYSMDNTVLDREDIQVCSLQRQHEYRIYASLQPFTNTYYYNTNYSNSDGKHECSLTLLWLRGCRCWFPLKRS